MDARTNTDTEAHAWKFTCVRACARAHTHTHTHTHTHKMHKTSTNYKNMRKYRICAHTRIHGAYPHGRARESARVQERHWTSDLQKGSQLLFTK